MSNFEFFDFNDCKKKQKKNSLFIILIDIITISTLRSHLNSKCIASYAERIARSLLIRRIQVASGRTLEYCAKQLIETEINLGGSESHSKKYLRR